MPSYDRPTNQPIPSVGCSWLRSMSISVLMNAKAVAESSRGESTREKLLLEVHFHGEVSMRA